jgi:hypothetical protein
MLFRRAITRISPKNFSTDAEAQSHQLQLSVDFSSILKEIKQGDSSIFHVYGEPGSGCSTLVQGLCQSLCGIDHIKEDQVFYLSLNKDCNEKSLWDVMSEVAKERNDKERATFFSKTSVQKDQKIKTFLKYDFKVICFDNADCNENLIESLLDHFVDCRIKTFIIDVQNKRYTTIECVTSVEVRGLNISTAQGLLETLCHPSNVYFTELQISNLCDNLNCNPVAIKIFCAFVNSQEMDNVSKTVMDAVNTACSIKYQQSKDTKQLDKFALDWILDYIGKSLESSSISVLYKCCSLRRPLPLIEISSEINELINLHLLTVKEEGGVSFISIDPCLQKHLSCRKYISSVKDTDFSVLDCWLSLVTIKLQSLIQDAEDNAWPFVPEKWYEYLLYFILINPVKCCYTLFMVPQYHHGNIIMVSSWYHHGIIMVSSWYHHGIIMVSKKEKEKEM